MDTQLIRHFCDCRWTESIIPCLKDYIQIPNKSPMFDPQWQANGYMDQAVALAMAWVQQFPARAMHAEVIRLPGRTPLIFIDIAGVGGDPVLLYGHLDKQPEMVGWSEGLGAWNPVLRGDKLYGRGGADDGYAIFASLTAINALQDQSIPHRRCVVIIECCEESGSFDLPFYIDTLKSRIGNPNLVICLDSGCGNYEQMWLTTSLRGLVGGTLRVEMLSEGVHSGDASGVVASSFRVARILLDRIEDARDGDIKLRAMHTDIPPIRIEQAAYAAGLLQDDVYRRFPFVTGAQPTCTDVQELILRRTWRPALSITGGEGLPALESAGNVLRPYTAFKLSLRLPPTVKAEIASQKLKQILEQDPPFGANIKFVTDQAANGWHAPHLQAWLDKSIQSASMHYFGKQAVQMGEGGSIPFMCMLGKSFPNAQFVITGVLGPKSNAHGPNEFLHIPTAKKLTCCIANIIADHAAIP